jgi:hypothetical protein
MLALQSVYFEWIDSYSARFIYITAEDDNQSIRNIQIYRHCI